MAEPPTQAEWRGWIDAHAPRLLLFARQKARCEADAQDLVQEAVVECWQRCGPDLPPLRLLFATIQRRAIDRARQEDRRARREQVARVDDTQPWFDSGVADRELSQVIQAVLAELPAEQREVITLKVWGELTFAEIAEALDIPLNTAASRHRYGMDALRRLTKQVLA
jgi:RNA polymerase sigma-70 factor (ECF subfamily)